MQGKPPNVTKNGSTGPVRSYESIVENGLTRLDKPKQSCPKWFYSWISLLGRCGWT
jgi:hypothetical protein